MNEQKNCFKR